MRSRNALRTISRSCRRPVVAGSLLAAVLFLVLLLPSTQVQSAGPNLGGARVTSVVGVGGACVSGPDGNAVQNWEVAEGQSYVVTLSNVLDCANNGTDATFQVMVKSSDTGNVCYTAQKQSTGVYTFTVNIPSPACNTFPILYCTTNCDPSTGMFARRRDGGDFQSHLRAATFDGSCNFTGVDTDCTGGGGLKGAISACKFYDLNANQVLDPGELPLDGWPMTLSPLDGAIPQVATQLTSGGCVSWANLDPSFNPFTVTEGTPNELNWVHSTPNPVSTNVALNQVNEVLFGNYCLVPSGGLTLGFWSNKNGQAILLAHDPAWRTLLNGCCLRNADGTIFQVPTGGSFATAYSAFRTWLLNANATNMAYMLSAQLAAMKLNIAFGSVNPASFDLCSSGTIASLTTSANALLCADGTTLAGNPDRTAQEAAKNCLDALNNGGSVIPPTPCPYTFPPQ